MLTTYQIINGPNLNLLGVRQPEIYGDKTLHDIEQWLSEKWKQHSVQFLWKQSNHEGDLIDFIHQTLDSDVQGIIINPGAYSHTSLAIADALRAIKIPKIEVHISNVYSRESSRQVLLTAAACDAIMCGPSFIVYNSAAEALRHFYQG